MIAAGATGFRFDVYWSSVETGPGKHDGPTLWWIDWVMGQAKAQA